LVSALLKLHGLKLGWHYSHYFACPLFVESGERCSFPGEVHQRMCTAQQRNGWQRLSPTKHLGRNFQRGEACLEELKLRFLMIFVSKSSKKHSFSEDVWARFNASLKDLKVLEPNVLWELLPTSETRMTRNIMVLVATRSQRCLFNDRRIH